MKEIIWNKEQLINIKRIILSRANIRLTDELEFEHTAGFNGFRATGKSLYVELHDELEKLFFTTDKEEIKRVLLKASFVKVEENNNYGFLTNISKVRSSNLEEIFFIFKEIISQYEKAIDMVVKKSLDGVDSLDEAKKKIKEIQDSTEETVEERLVKIVANKVFIRSNGVTDSPLFESLFEKIETLIKSKIISRMQSIVSVQSRQEEKRKSDTIYRYNDVAIGRRYKTPER